MNRNSLNCLCLIFGLALPAQAALEFTNVTQQASANANTALNAVAFDGSGTFMGVGDNSTVLVGQFVAGSTNLLWITNTTPGPVVSLKSVAASGINQFAAGGANNVVYSSANAVSWEPIPTHPFGLATTVQGLAFNSSANRFAAVASIPNISYAENTLASWSPALLNSSVLIESFRGVTALSGNGFAACGRGGDIRISTDGAETWNVGRTYTVSEPELFGIASGAASQLISVGSAGRVMISNDGGANSATWIINGAPIGNINYAVAYTGIGSGNEFIVVGDGGRILTGSNAIAADWTTNATFSGNLRGVAFATSGIMKGVAMVVGDGGTVILGGTPPPAPTNPQDQAVCSGSGDTNLSVNLNTNGFPVGTLVVDWFDANGVLVATIPAASINYFAATNTIPDSGNYASNFVYNARARDLRTGFTSPSRAVTLTINPRPTSTTSVSGPNPICSGDPTEVQVRLTGIGPWTFTWLSNGIPVITNTCWPNRTNTLPVTPLDPNLSLVSDTVYAVTNLSDCTTTCAADPLTDLTNNSVVTIFPPVSVNAGADQAVCSSSPVVTLAGTVSGGASSGTWSGGAGTFNPNSTTLTATYTPSAGEITAGTVTLTLTSADPAGPCPAVSDTMTITINPAVVVNAGADQAVCSSSPNVILAGSVTGGATTGTWSGGAGTFNPNSTTLTATYTPSAGEITAGTVTLTLTSADPVGPCPAVSDTMTITINPAVVVNAGADQAVCSSSPVVTLAGSVTGGASSGTWSGGTGTFNPNATTLAATYTPSAGEISSAPTTVTLTLTSADPVGPCPARSDSMTITINPAAPAPLSLGDEIVCYGDTNLPSLRVSVAADQTANWFANALGGTAIAIGTTNFVPTQAGLGIHDYHAETSNMLTGCLSADRTKVSLAVVVCPTINWMSSTNIVVEWYGLMTLLSNTDLTLPGGWRTVLAPSGGNRTNHWTNSIVPPPTSTFFRLTNAPAGL